jgi:hypothetical protein
MLVLRSRPGRVAALLLSASTTIACAALTVNSYVESRVDLRSYQTFNWAPPDTFSTGDPRLDHNRFFDERVRMQVERGLAGRGFEKTADAPDLLVHYHASVNQRIDTSDLDRSDEHCEERDCAPDVYDAGTLVIDIVERRTKRLIWRGWAEGSLEGVIDDQEWLEKRIDDAVARILSRLPRQL